MFFVSYGVNTSFRTWTNHRWNNHLDPALSKAPWSEEEDRIIIQTQAIHGNKWAEMSRLLPGR